MAGGIVPDPLFLEIGERVAMWRKHRRMTQKDLADNIGCSRTSLANLEAGRQKIELPKLYDIAEWLDIDLHRLLPARRP